jgi:hypothetical protein
MGKNRQGALMPSLGNLAYLDGYRLFEALRNGDRVAFTVGEQRYEAQFQGDAVGAENWLEVTDGTTKGKWGWGWCSETCFHLLHDLTNGRFHRPYFRYKGIASVSSTHTLLV